VCCSTAGSNTAQSDTAHLHVHQLSYCYICHFSLHTADTAAICALPLHKTHVQPPHSPRATAARAQITYCTHESAVSPGACTKLLAETSPLEPAGLHKLPVLPRPLSRLVSHPTSRQTEQTRNTIAICLSNKTKNRYMTQSCLQQHACLVAQSCWASLRHLQVMQYQMTQPPFTSKRE